MTKPLIIDTVNSENMRVSFAVDEIAGIGVGNAGTGRSWVTLKSNAAVTVTNYVADRVREVWFAQCREQKGTVVKIDDEVKP